MTKNKSQSKILRNVIYKIYEGLSTEYRKKVDSETFYKNEMQKIINDFKAKI